MCGIFGGAPELISKDAERLLRHRGPDQQGRVVVKARNGRSLVVGQARLSVVYKEDVPTPMTRGEAVIAFNGEVYNWLELRRELEAKGHRFETPTDTEMVLAAYLEWGPSCLERFNGMFAIAIWHDDKLFLARDRLGKKPLFWSHEARPHYLLSMTLGALALLVRRACDHERPLDHRTRLGEAAISRRQVVVEDDLGRGALLGGAEAARRRRRAGLLRRSWERGPGSGGALAPKPCS